MLLHDLAFGGTYLRLPPDGIELLLGRARTRFKFDPRLAQILTEIHLVLHL